MTIRLPHDAHGYDYEDQVCSILLAHGYYLETRLILKKGLEEVLEFDAIATPVNNHKDRKVVEVKSGKWGISDIFKLYGQVMYTAESGAWLFHKKAAPDTKKQAISEVTEKVPVSTININIGAENQVEEVPAGLTIPDDVATVIFSTSWWSRSAERIAQSRFRDWCKSQTNPPEVVSSAQTYLSSMDECLFKQNPLARVNALYDAYKAAPQITSSLIDHLATSEKSDIGAVRKTVFGNNGRPHIQYVAAQEYRARVAIMKNAYNALLDEEATQEKNRSGSSLSEIIQMLLPASFRNGMRALRSYPYANHIPFFYQVFVEVLGGFYIPDDEREMDFMAKATGIPPEQIPAALEILDAFFPIEKGWVHDGDKVRFLKGLPAYLKGAGCFARENI
jgi:hypothetical protein